MSWTLKFNDKAVKELRRLGSKDQVRILSFLTSRAAERQNPRELAVQLVGQDSDKWRFWVGDCRVVVQFRDSEMLIMVISVGHRREVYR
jgi:mRNA interferase RelE/StbE